MEKEIIWSNNALDDLDDASLYRYTVQPPEIAEAFYHGAFSRAQTLSTLADRGRLIAESDDPFVRAIPYENYEIVYRAYSDYIYVLAFAHERQLFKLR